MTEAAVRSGTEHSDILYALEQASGRVSDAEAQRRSAMSDIGALLRQGRELHARRGPGFPRLEVTEAQDRTGLSRPTLYKAMADVPDATGRDPRAWSNAYLAATHAGYGYGGHEAIDAEFWRRYPHLHGWRNAILCLTAHQAGQRREASSAAGLDPLAGDGPGEPAPGTRILAEAYRAAVDAIAGPAGGRRNA
jgi:hypothetical protein